MTAEQLAFAVERSGGILELKADGRICFELPKDAGHLLPLLREHKQELILLLKARAGCIRAFPEWARTVGGVVEHAGYRCPFETPRIVESVDADAADMRSLVTAMEKVRKFANRELMDLARREELFPGLVGRSDDEMTTSQRSAWGRMLSRYHDRAVGEHRFFSDGKGHSRRFWAERIRG